MTTFALVHGSGDGGWAWHLVVSALRARGHDAVAPDLPTDRDDATWDDCATVVAAAVGDVCDVVVVGQSAGGFVVPLAAERLGARLQVYVAALVPSPGESAADWFEHVGWSGPACADVATTFFHDVAEPLAREARDRERPTSERLGSEPWPLAALPAIPARYVVTSRDRFLPPSLQRRVAVDRLGLTAADVIGAGHCPHLADPDGLADLLAGYVA